MMRTRGCLAGLLAATAVMLASAAAKAEVCTVGTSPVAFGVYDPLAAAPLDSTGNVAVTCTSVGNPRVRYIVELSTGQAGTYNPRAMTNGVSQLTYDLYVNAARTRVWGDGSGGTRRVRANYRLLPIGSTQTDNYTVYGRVFPGQNVSVGSYLDTIIVTVTF